MAVVLSALGIGTKAIRITEEFDRLLRITAWLRECLEAELTAEAGLAGDRPAKLGGAVIEKWQKVVLTFEKLTAAKIRMDKNGKALAEAMTPEEELEAVRQYVRSLDPKKRLRFLEQEAEWHTHAQEPK